MCCSQFQAFRSPSVCSISSFFDFFLVSSATATVSSMLEIEAGLASRESSASASASAARFPCVPVCVLLQEKADDWINVSKSRRFCLPFSFGYFWSRLQEAIEYVAI